MTFVIDTTPQRRSNTGGTQRARAGLVKCLPPASPPAPPEDVTVPPIPPLEPSILTDPVADSSGGLWVGFVNPPPASFKNTRNRQNVNPPTVTLHCPLNQSEPAALFPLALKHSPSTPVPPKLHPFQSVPSPLPPTADVPLHNPPAPLPLPGSIVTVLLVYDLITGRMQARSLAVLHSFSDAAAAAEDALLDAQGDEDGCQGVITALSTAAGTALLVTGSQPPGTLVSFM